MATGLLLPILLVSLVVLAVRRARGQDADAPPDGHALRRIFQYALLYGLTVVVAIGLAGLLGRLMEGAILARSDQAELARSLAFTVVGTPLLAGVALWSRRKLADDAAEARSLGWASFITAASLTCLIMTMNGTVAALRWAAGLQDFSGRALAQALVWAGLWAVLWWIDRRVTPPEHTRVHHLAGSLIGLVTAATGLGGVLAGALRVLSGLDAGAVLTSGGNPILQGLVTFVTGAAVWSIYWLRTAERDEREPLLLAYVLLAGVAGGLVSAVVAASTLVYTGLVWVLGEPGSTVAAEHFDAAPTATATVVVGMLVWWYHQAVLGEVPGTRTEVTRVYEYLMAGIGLLAATGGLITLVVALVDALAGHAFVGGSIVNTLLAGATLLTVGGPVWWLYWRTIQAAARDTGAEGEVTSPTRRVYLDVLFGVAAVAAVVALVLAVYLLLHDVVSGTVGAETFRRTRFALGVLLSAPAIAGYHWTVRQEGRRHRSSASATPGPRFLLLVGPSDRAIGREVARRTHGRVQTWTRTDDDAPTWTADDVMAVLGDTTAEEVIVLSEAGRLHAIPVRRRPVVPLQDKGSAAIGNIGAGQRVTAGQAAPPLPSSKASRPA